MGARPAGRVALMAIHPRYAEAILDGCKHVEFRKRPLASDVRTVVIYATAPVKRVVGEFTVDRIVIASPEALWEVAGSVGGIDKPSYYGYYAASDTAIGILVGVARRYPFGLPLHALNPEPAVPQSFAYLPADQFAQLRELVGVDSRPILARLAAGLAAVLRAAMPRHAMPPVIPLPISDPLQHDEQAVAQR